MKANVSIIVPVYNSEKFLDRCILSILNQKLKEFELILIDDGSTDNSLKICKKHASKDKRIKVINKENGGVSSARNLGLKMAVGKYVGFVDSDDYIEPTMYFKMYEKAKTGFDIVNCDYYDCINGIKTKCKTNFKKNVQITQTMMVEYLSKAHQSNVIWFTWRNIYKREMLENNNITFDESLKIGEDPLFNLYAFYHSKSTISIDKALYNYDTNLESLTQTKHKKDLLTKFDIQYKAKKKFYNNTGLYSFCRNDFHKNYIEHSLMMLIKNVYNSNGNYIEQLDKIRNSNFIEESFKNYKTSKINPKQIFLLMFKFDLFHTINLVFGLKKLIKL